MLKKNTNEKDERNTDGRRGGSGERDSGNELSQGETVLYRKYRPQKWAEVLGQDHIVKVLKGSLELGRISHAYLFSGGRGTGKTTFARIFANELGCANEDIYEIDAASNRGIDDIRELREAVSTSPFRSKYKVYIIDEVHMLTKEAFNALLKTLEEPPKHVIFMLATTEKDALPDTVVSRCQILELKKPTREILIKLISGVTKSEGFTLEAGASELIAELGDGSFRDTLGVLQKILSFSEDKKVTLKEVELVTGAPRSELVRDFIKAIISKNTEEGFKVLDMVNENGADINIFAGLVLEKLRNILTVSGAPSLSAQVKERVSEADFEFINGITGPANINRIELTRQVARAISSLIDSLEKIKRSANPSAVLEVYCVNLTS